MMLRTLMFFGFLSSFVWFAYVHPTQANALKLKNTVDESRARLNIEDFLSADIAQDVKGRANGAVALLKIRQELPHQLAGNKIVDMLNGVLGIDLPGLRTRRPNVWRAATNDADEALLDALERIEWARVNSAVRACGELNPSSVAEGPSKGDVIAYCIARVMAEPQRCFQIHPGASPDLRLLCAQEFAL